MDMFNPDAPDEKKTPLPLAPQVPRELESEYQVFRRYLMDSSQQRKAYGLGKNMDGQFWIEDVEKGLRTQGKYRVFLRQFCDEMKRSNRWRKKDDTGKSSPVPFR